MASQNSEAEPWELDTKDIASVTSEDLYDHRPNRWRGPKSTWRHLTQEERDLWRSMNQLRDRDLAVHLYNAHALKSRASRNDLVVHDEDGQDRVWTLPKAWTAWPVNHKLLPEEPFIKDTDDGNNDWTFRMSWTKTSSSDLHNELGAHILKLAKQRVLGRKVAWAEAEAAVASSESSSDVEENEDMQDRLEHKTVHRTTPGSSPGARDLEPGVSAEDEKSDRILAQPIRHILSKLDDTLTILHNMRQTHRRRRNSDSVTSASDSEPERSRSASAKRRRGRPRQIPLLEKDDPTSATKITATKRGRPKRVYTPRDGETQEQMAVRVARENHRKLPTTQKERDEALLSRPRDLLTEEELEERYHAWLRSDGGDERKTSDYEDQRVDKVDDQSGGAPRTQRHNVGSASPSVPDGTQAQQAQTNKQRSKLAADRQKKLAQLGLRDWSDIIGAAALAGFPEAVVSRAAQRCADLFGEGMAINRLNEVPVKEGSGLQQSIYRPGKIRLSYEEEDVFLSDDEDPGHDSAGSASVDIDPAGRQSRVRSSTPRRASRSRSRSRSVTSCSSPGQFYCPVPHCPRASEGFSRRANLKRHVDLVHPHFQNTADIDSEDEVLGGVHRDGFVKGIVPGRGWRGEDKAERKRKRTWGQKNVMPRINVSGQLSQAQITTDNSDSASH